MRTISALVAAVSLAASASAAEVWYIPGWNRTQEVDGLAYDRCTNVFANATCRFHIWDGNRMWGTSAKNADAEAVRLADRIAAMDTASRTNLTLVGHSLGGRIIARTLSKLSERDLKIRQGILLAPAIPMKELDVARMGGGSVQPVLLLCNPQDVVLKYVFTIAGGEETPSLGADGTPWVIPNVIQYSVPDDITEQTPIDALWGKSETVKRICNHLAAFYFTELGKILDGTPSPRVQVRVPQDKVNVETKVMDAGIWWTVVDEHRGWKFERNIVTGHCRILNPDKRRVAWGNEAELRRSFDAIRLQLRTP